MAENPDNNEYDSQDSDEIPDFANDQNKKLHQLVKEKKKVIKDVYKEYEQDFERHKILKEHLKNVDQQLIHTQGLIDAKDKQTQTENHLKQITERQVGRLESELKKMDKQAIQFQERLNDTQVRIFKTGEKAQQLKLQLNWNQEQLEQWAIAGKQKEEDNVTLQKYRKEDDTKLRQLSLQIQKLTVEVGRKQNQLEKQITETQTAQIQLDKTAEEFKKQHDQRHKLFQKWQQVTKNIAKRNNEINDMGQHFADVKIAIGTNSNALQQKKVHLATQARSNKEEQARNMLLMREISDRKNQIKKVEFEDIANLQAEVQILKNKLSTDATILASKRNKVALTSQQLLAKKQRLHTEQIKYAAHQSKLKNEQKLAVKFDQAKANAEERYKQNMNQKKKIQQQITNQKQALVKSTQDLFKLRESQAALYGEIQGNMAACRNLQSHINKLNQQFQRQQQLLYNAEYQIQLMQRKVSRAKGQRTLEQKKDLQKDLDEANIKNTEIKTQYKILNESVKKLDQDLRSVENRLNEVKSVEKKYTSLIEELSLENDMTYQDLNKVSKKKQEVLVQHDIMKLEIKKIRENLTKATDNVFSLENKKNQIEMSMQQREKQIQVHKDVLQAEYKASEEERHKVAIQLAERRNKVKNLKIKYEALVQKSHGSNQQDQNVAEHSQAYYVIKAAQQRQELQRKGDQLSAKIIKSQKDLKALQNTLLCLRGINGRAREKYINKGISKDDIQQKQALQDQCNAASQNLFKKKKQAQRIDKEYEQDMRRYTELQNKFETLNDRKKKLSQQMMGLVNEINEGKQKMNKAQKSLNLKLADMNKRKFEPDMSSPHLAQLQYDIEVNKNRTLISCLLNLSNEIPEIGPLLEQILKEKNIELPSKAPSSIDLMSSKASSIRSGGSAISKASKASKK